MMNATFIVEPTSSSMAPCSPNEVITNLGDCVEIGVEEWLEDEALGGFRVWQVAGIILSVVLAFVVGLCCCIKFRIPRTKQDIEADYIRKKIAKNFHKELAKIDNVCMDEMDLRKALERVRAGLEVENEELEKHRGEIHGKKKSHEGLGARFHAMVHGVRMGFAKNSDNTTKTKIRRPSDSEA